MSSQNPNPNPNPFQIFLQFPSISPQTLAITITNPNQTLRDLLPSPLPLSVSLNGRILDPSTTIRAIAPLSSLILRPHLLGGGGDGGSTCAESRDCYLNMYATKKPDKADRNEQRLSKWTNCALSFEPLKPPCVIDRLGNVFNKETLVKALLDKSLPKGFRHIKGLKDMIDVELDSIPGAEGETKFQCPISGLEFNGMYKFFALKGCGHVISAKAMKEVKSEKACLVCRKEFGVEDRVPINGSEEELEVLRERLEAERAGSKVKKAKKGVISGTKHGIEGVKDDGVAPAKKFKAIHVAPAHANKKVYASLFTSSSKSNIKETYSCRSLPLGRN